MKSIKIISTLIFFTATLMTVKAFSQKPSVTESGLYASVNDYEQHVPKYPADCGSTKDFLRTDELFNSSRVTVIHNGEKHAFNKSDLYGFRDCKNNEYRFFNNREYQIVDTAGFYLYRISVYVKEGKAYNRETTAWYFSKIAGDVILPLTIENLKTSYPENNKFHYALDEEFKSDKTLSEYDKFLKKYKVKYIYQQSSQ